MYGYGTSTCGHPLDKEDEPGAWLDPLELLEQLLLEPGVE
jgi:hypothetical protein